MELFKRTRIYTATFAALIALPLFAIGAPAHAADEPIIVSSFCAQVNQAANSFGQLVSDNESKYAEDKIARIASLGKTRGDGDKALAAARTKADAAYADQFKALMDQAQTKEQKDAALAFQKTMSAAILARRKSVDAALKTYRAGIDKIIGDRADTYGTALGTLRTSVSSYLESLRAGCASDPTMTEVPATTSANIQAARGKFKSTVDELAAPDADIDILATARDSAISTAETVFQIAEQAAVAKVKAAFGE